MKTRVLWIEDAALLDLNYLVGPVFFDGTLDLSITMSATEGLRKLTSDEFECVVIDIRLPPGDDRRWIDLYNESGHNKAAAQLGLWLAQSVLRPRDEKTKIRLDEVPRWLSPSRVGFLSVEPLREVKPFIDALQVSTYKEKSIDDGDALLDVIKSVLRH